jgi:hypothetical protein
MASFLENSNKKVWHMVQRRAKKLTRGPRAPMNFPNLAEAKPKRIPPPAGVSKT